MYIMPNFPPLQVEIKEFLHTLITFHQMVSNHSLFQALLHTASDLKYRQVSNISRTSVGNAIVDHSDVVGASPVGAAPTSSSFST